MSTEIGMSSPLPDYAIRSANLPVGRAEDRGEQLNEDQKRSQISSGHRLLNLARQHRYHLYSQDEMLSTAERVPASYWLETFCPSLQNRMNEMIAQRVNAAIARARKHHAAYDVRTLGVPEFVAEALFDNKWFKIREDHVSRSEVRDQVKVIIEEGKQLELLLPLMSRKPFSPIKNRGFNADLAELFSLVRCAQAAQVVNALSPTGCRMTILADGHKYNRGCRTPDEIVSLYQDGLRFWISHLGISDIVHLANYEEWLASHLSPSVMVARSLGYAARCDLLSSRFNSLFDPADLLTSLSRVKALDDLGEQLTFAYWSIVTSTYYPDLFNLSQSSGIERHYTDQVQNIYGAYAATLHKPLARLGHREDNFSATGYIDSKSYRDLFYVMRRDAWEAAKRYVAISLADRDFNLLRRVSPQGVKLTIHGKKGEIHFLSATMKDATMTAQHCVGGLSMDERGSKVSFRYRLERESDKERPVLLEKLPGSSHDRELYGPLWHMQRIGQPMCYLNGEASLSNRRILDIHT